MSNEIGKNRIRIVYDFRRPPRPRGHVVIGTTWFHVVPITTYLRGGGGHSGRPKSLWNRYEIVRFLRGEHPKSYMISWQIVTISWRFWKAPAKIVYDFMTNRDDFMTILEGPGPKSYTISYDFFTKQGDGDCADCATTCKECMGSDTYCTVRAKKIKKWKS